MLVAHHRALRSLVSTASVAAFLLGCGDGGGSRGADSTPHTLCHADVPDGGKVTGHDSGAGASESDGTSVVTGRPGCGLPSAAFCDTFDSPSAIQGRAGELDARWWSASRFQGGPTSDGTAYP